MNDWDRVFDDLYLKTYAPIQHEADAEQLAVGAMQLAECGAPADVLDAACGYGRHSQVLARAGYRVVGLDRSSVLLAEARRRFEGTTWPRWVQGDYRELPFDAESFDAVINLFTSFGFFGSEDDMRVLKEFRRVLRPGGALVLETMHRDRLMAIFQTHNCDALPHEAVRLSRRTFDPVEGIVEEALTYWPKGGEPTTANYRLRIYTATELKRMALEADFLDIQFYGDAAGGPLSRDSRLVLVARPATTAN
jgi:ubiquinone/menaquinone biosynthesis C-methylase UbiE